VIGAGGFACMSWRPLVWSAERRGREARAHLARERAAGRRRSFEPLNVTRQHIIRFQQGASLAADGTWARRSRDVAVATVGVRRYHLRVA